MDQKLSAVCVMRDDDRSGYEALRQRIAKMLSAEHIDVAANLKHAIPDWQLCRGYRDFGTRFQQLSMDVASRFSDALARINQLLVIDFALELHLRLVDRNLPEAVTALYPGQMSRLLHYLQSPSAEAEYANPGEHFFADLRLVAGFSVPCGAQSVDLASPLGRAGLLRLLMSRNAFDYASHLIRKGGLVPWFRAHTDSRNLDDFNEAGWEQCHLRIASLLESHPEVLGMVGTAWFYDPQVESISPNLAYIRRRPLERGAILARNRGTQQDIIWSTATSKKRRQLYEAGKYRPVPYSIIWPRAAMLAWAEQHGGTA